jgi:hypothetical protein
MKFFSVLGAVILAIPFYYLWNYFAPIYLPQLPHIYLSIPFWHCVGLFATVGIVKSLLFCDC